MIGIHRDPNLVIDDVIENMINDQTENAYLGVKKSGKSTKSYKEEQKECEEDSLKNNAEEEDVSDSMDIENKFLSANSNMMRDLKSASISPKHSIKRTTEECAKMILSRYTSVKNIKTFDSIIKKRNSIT